MGAVLKRTADRLVRQGMNLPNAQEVFSKLQGITNVELHFVDSVAVNTAVDAFQSSHTGTMNLHQLYADSSVPGQLQYRALSCFCQGICKFCSCFDLKTFQFRLSENDSAQPSSDISSISGTENSSLDARVVTVTSNVQLSDVVLQSSLLPITSDNHADLVGKYGVVKYNNKAYPGKTLAMNETDIRVDCMHCTGTRYDSNRFFWPDKMKDICLARQDERYMLVYI